MNSYGLKNLEWQEMLDIFKQNSVIEEVILFGSRAKNTFKPMSDVDIVVYGNIKHSDLNKIENDFEESNLPFTFDVVVASTIKSEELLEHLKKYGKKIYMKGWVETTLGDVCNIQSGGTPSTKNNDYWNGDIGWITPKDLSNNKDVFIQKGERSITQAGLEGSSAKLLPKHTILFSSRAPIGYVVIAENEITTNQGFKNLICDEKQSHYKYFYYLLKFKAEHIEKLSSGSTFSEASAALMKSIEIAIPPLPEQKAIANILTAFDDKIENLQAQNKTLESIAQTIFKEWFGKYQIGDELPEGWRVGKLGELINIKYGKDHKHLQDGQFPLYGSGGIMRYVEKPLYSKESILIPRKGTLSNLFYLEEPFWSVDTMFYSQIMNLFQGRFIFLFLKSINLSDMNVGSAVPSLTTQVLNQISIVIPNDDIMFEFNTKVCAFYRKIKKNTIQIQTLTKTRDTLLPKLMSGQLRVKDFKE